jgi:hypothetical protein
MKQKHWIEAARIATTRDFSTAYGALTFIVRECPTALHDAHVVDWLWRHQGCLYDLKASASLHKPRTK